MLNFQEQRPPTQLGCIVGCLPGLIQKHARALESSRPTPSSWSACCSCGSHQRGFVGRCRSWRYTRILELRCTQKAVCITAFDEREGRSRPTSCDVEKRTGKRMIVGQLFAEGGGWYIACTHFSSCMTPCEVAQHPRSQGHAQAITLLCWQRLAS